MGPVKAQIQEFDAYIRNNNIPDTRKGGGKEKIPDSPFVAMLKKAEEALAKHAAETCPAVQPGWWRVSPIPSTVTMPPSWMMR